MKMTVTMAAAVVFCLLVTGCSRFQLTQDSELSFYDPFVGESGFAADQHPQNPIASQPVTGGRVRITDYRQPNLDEPNQARYPEVVETDMRLAATGIENSKPRGITDPDPYYLTQNETRTQLDARSAEAAEMVAGIEVDPFAAQVSQASHVVSTATQPGRETKIPEATYVQHTSAETSQFVEPVLATTMVETVAIPVDDAPTVAQSPTVRQVDDGFRPSRQAVDNTDSIGWRRAIR